jgi:hypothetical protein
MMLTLMRMPLERLLIPTPLVPLRLIPALDSLAVTVAAAAVVRWTGATVVKQVPQCWCWAWPHHRHDWFSHLLLLLCEHYESQCLVLSFSVLVVFATFRRWSWTL